MHQHIRSITRSLKLRTLLFLTTVVAVAAALQGCNDAQSAVADVAPPAPKVQVAAAIKQQITDWDEFTGRFEAVEHVELRPRVSGYIEALRFVEGSEVAKDDVLFTIDARPYELALARARADYARVKAAAALAESERGRAEQLLQARAISRQEYDQRVSGLSQTQAELRAAEAAVGQAQLNLDYTAVRAPIAGRVSSAQVTAGNYVTAGQTVLTSLVSLDPIYVSFDGDEQVYLKYQAQEQRGQRPSSREAANPVQVGLANEPGFPHAGRMNFVDNALNPATGTIHGRAVLDNPHRLFVPGMFARLRLLGSGSYGATLIADASVATDQDRRYVLVVNDQNVVEYRSVELGEVHDALRVVRSGVEPGERIVVGGLQHVQPGMTVAPEDVALKPLPAAGDARTLARN
jgi:RND family efflux transporter MFP subunit